MRVPLSAVSVQQNLNATPMMDVMLVLLVIFMVVTPLIHSGPDLVLPAAVRGEPVPEDSMLTIRLNFSGQLSSPSGRWAGEALAEFVKQHPGIIVMLEADRRLPYRVVEDVLARLGEAGLGQVGLVALKRSSN